MQHNTKQHKAITNWAADCAERVLPLFEGTKPGDGRPKAAIAAARRWANGKLSMAEARKAAVAAHAAARDAVNSSEGRDAARAAAHAAASAHVPTHARHAANYAIKAVIAAGGDDLAEEKWQDEKAPLPQ